MKTKKVENVYAVRCFLNKKRMLTHKLTKTQAKVFHKTALHLADYLTKEYLDK